MNPTHPPQDFARNSSEKPIKTHGFPVIFPTTMATAPGCCISRIARAKAVPVSAPPSAASVQICRHPCRRWSSAWRCLGTPGVGGVKRCQYEMLWIGDGYTSRICVLSQNDDLISQHAKFDLLEPTFQSGVNGSKSLRINVVKERHVVGMH